MFVWHLLLADKKHCSAACVLNNCSLAKIDLLLRKYYAFQKLTKGVNPSLLRTQLCNTNVFIIHKIDCFLQDLSPAEHFLL